MSITGRDYWHQKPKGKAHGAIVDAVKYIDDTYGDRRKLNEQNLRLYGNRNFSGFGPGQYHQQSGSDPRLKLNLVKSVIDTNTAEHASNKPKPMFLTIGGDWSMQRKGKNLSRFISGVFHQTKLYDTAHEVRRDRGIFGTGGVKIWGEVTPSGKGRLHCRRVFPDDVLVDEQEARTGEPRQLFYVLPAAKDWIASKNWPIKPPPAILSKATLIRKGDQNRSDSMKLADQCSIIESWLLPTGEGSGDGRHVISIQGATLRDEEWKSERFPIVLTRRSRQPLGFWGYGIAEEITPIQIEVNDILEYMEAIISYHAPHILVEKGSKVNKAHINNVAWSMIEYIGQKPEWLVPGMFPAGLLDYLERRVRAAYEITGSNLMLAQAQKPRGDMSGKALDSLNDTGSRRNQVDGLNDQQWFLDCADLFIEEAKNVDEEMRETGHGPFKVMVPRGKGRQGLDELSWPDVDMPRDVVQMQSYPISFFSSTPTEKWNQIAEMKREGVLTPEHARSLMDWPDTEEWADRENAPYDMTRMQIEDIIEHGIPAEVEPFHNHQLILQTAPKALYEAQRDGVPADRLELIRRMILDAKAWIDRATPIQQVSQGATPLTHRAPVELPPGSIPPTEVPMQ